MDDLLTLVKGFDMSRSPSRRVRRVTAPKIPYAVAVQIAGVDRWAAVPESTRKQYKREGVPASQLGAELWQWFQGTMPPREVEPPLPGPLESLILHAKTSFAPLFHTPLTPAQVHLLEHIIDQVTIIADNLKQREIIRQWEAELGKKPPRKRR